MEEDVLGVPTWQWIAAACVILGSAITSGSETALTALGDLRARQLLDSGGRRARLLRNWVEHPDRVLSALLVTNTLLNIGGGVLAGEIATRIAEAHGLSPGRTLGVATAVATILVLFAGEVVPKTIAKRHPVRISLAVIPFVSVVSFALWPVSAGLVRATQGLLWIFGGGRVAPPPAVTSEEIEYIIEMGTREGVLDEVKEELLNSVLEFADRVVKEIMIPRTRMVAVDRDAPPEEIVRVVTENPFSRMPVFQGSVDNVIGILMVREAAVELARGARTIPWDKVMKPAFFVPEQMKVSRLLKEMQRRKTHLAVVVDEFGGTSGVVTLEDALEEIVGEIQDEGDAEAAPVRNVGAGVWLADATVPLRELEEYLDRETGVEPGAAGAVRFPDEGDYETLGGFVTATAGRVPPVGAHVDQDGFRFTVRAADERRVTRVEIARRQPEAVAAGEARA
jgi:CBS domain containing-hemolysin-like protein